MLDLNCNEPCCKPVVPKSGIACESCGDRIPAVLKWATCKPCLDLEAEADAAVSEMHAHFARRDVYNEVDEFGCGRWVE